MRDEGWQARLAEQVEAARKRAREPTDRETCSVYHLGGIEYIVADEEDMPAVMRCVRMSGYHGHYRRAGEEKEYRF